MENRGQASTASGINLLLGVWLIAAPFILGYAEVTPRWNDIILGILIGGVALIRMMSPTRSTTWLSWANVLFGVWLIVAPFILGYASSVPLWNDIILGVIVTGLSFWSISATSQRPRITHA